MPGKVDKNALASRIREIEGLSNDEKSALLELLNTRKKYGLVWEEKAEAVEELLSEKLPVFTEVPAKRITAKPLEKDPGKLDLFGDKGKDAAPAPDHIIVEGDNLHALTALQYTHAGKIDVIEIDPPYNTGNKDFIYNDSYVDKEDSWRHSKWLCFMSKRLKLAKTLLKETGVIFIHIDDNEQAQLKLLCDEIFGEQNHIADFIWKSRQIIDSRNQTFASIDHEFVIAFGKTPNSILRGKASDKEKYSNPDKDHRGPWMSNSILGLADADNRPNLHYTLVDPETSYEYPCPPATGWRYSPDTMATKLAEKRIVFPKKKDGRPREKKFLSELKSDFTGFSSILSEDAGYTLNGTRELREIFGEGLFGFPKPVSLIKMVVQQSIPSDSIILDFFAGSGTTLHATMALNAEDGGSRRCILVTNNENNICEEVTYERNKRVIQGYTKQNGEAVAGLTNNNLRYYKTDFIEREPTLKNRKALTRAAIDLLCIRENCYTSYKEFDTKEIRVFSGKEHELMIIFDPENIDTAIEIIQKLLKRCKVYIFSPGHYAFDDEFEPVMGKIELCALPEAIYQAYKAVLPKAKRRLYEEPVQEEAVAEIG
jgi:adenine-specific DNA-methyltransferase